MGDLWTRIYGALSEAGSRLGREDVACGNRRDSLTRQLHGGGVELLLTGVLRQCFVERLEQQVWAEA